MSRALKCDICGEMVEFLPRSKEGTADVKPNKMLFIYTNSDGYEFSKSVFDICPDCHAAIMATVNKIIDDKWKTVNPNEDDLK